MDCSFAFTHTGKIRSVPSGKNGDRCCSLPIILVCYERKVHCETRSCFSIARTNERRKDPCVRFVLHAVTC